MGCWGEAGVGADLRLDRWVLIRSGGVLPAALEVVAVAVHLYDVHVVGETVQQCPGESFRLEFRSFLTSLLGEQRMGGSSEPPIPASLLARRWTLEHLLSG